MKTRGTVSLTFCLSIFFIFACSPQSVPISVNTVEPYKPPVIQSTATPRPSSEWLKYQITYTLRVSKYSGRVRVWIPIPVEWVTQKDVKIMEISPKPVEISEDVHGNQMAFWQINVAARNTQDYQLIFEVSILKKKWDFDVSKTGEYDKNDPVYLNYLGSTSLVQTNNPMIIEKAREIVGEEKNPYIKSKLIYDYLEKYLVMGGDSNDAVTTLKEKRGQCGGVANLYVALCRAVGVPARTIVGMGNLSGTKNFPAQHLGTHVFSEVYLPYYGWIPVEVRTFDSKNGYGVFDGNFLIMSKGPEIILGHGADNKNWFHLPVINGSQEEAEQITLEVKRIIEG